MVRDRSHFIHSNKQFLLCTIIFTILTLTICYYLASANGAGSDLEKLFRINAPALIICFAGALAFGPFIVWVYGSACDYWGRRRK